MTYAYTCGVMTLLADTEVAAILKVDRATLRRWRESNTGPCYVRIGPKLIRYRQEELNRWVGACQVRTPGHEAETIT